MTDQLSLDLTGGEVAELLAEKSAAEADFDGWDAEMCRHERHTEPWLAARDARIEANLRWSRANTFAVLLVQGLGGT